MPTATQQDIDTAKAMLAKRVTIEQQLSQAVKTKIRELFNRIADLGYAEQIQPMMFRFSRMKRREELDALLAELRSFLYMVAERYSQTAIDMVEDEYGTFTHLEAAEFINKEKNGKTLRQRVATYTERMRTEYETWVAAGLVLGLTADNLKQQFSLHSAQPYSNPAFNRAAVAVAGNRRNAATRLASGGVSYGRGVYVSAENSILRLELYTIADAMRMAQFLSFGSSNGIVGYYIGRGSSYPCEQCDDEVGFKPLGYGELPPYHNNCKCWAAPVYVG